MNFGGNTGVSAPEVSTLSSCVFCGMDFHPNTEIRKNLKLKKIQLFKIKPLNVFGYPKDSPLTSSRNSRKATNVGLSSGF